MPRIHPSLRTPMRNEFNFYGWRINRALLILVPRRKSLENACKSLSTRSCTASRAFRWTCQNMRSFRGHCNGHFFWIAGLVHIGGCAARTVWYWSTGQKTNEAWCSAIGEGRSQLKHPRNFSPHPRFVPTPLLPPPTAPTALTPFSLSQVLTARTPSLFRSQSRYGISSRFCSYLPPSILALDIWTDSWYRMDFRRWEITYNSRALRKFISELM